MPTLLDNRVQGKVGDVLREGIQRDARLSILSSHFSIYGYSCLKKQLSHAGTLRLILPSNDAAAGVGREYPFRVVGLTGSEADRRFRNSLNLTKVARECAEWLKQKADIKVVSLPAPPP